MTQRELLTILRHIRRIQRGLEKVLRKILRHVLKNQRKERQQVGEKDLTNCNICGAIKPEEQMKYVIDSHTFICTTKCLMEFMKRRRQKYEEEKKKQISAAGSDRNDNSAPTP